MIDERVVARLSKTHDLHLEKMCDAIDDLMVICIEEGDSTKAKVLEYILIKAVMESEKRGK